MGEILDLKYCPRTKHCKGRDALKKPTIRCVCRGFRLAKGHGSEYTFCGAWPAITKYMKANGLKVGKNVTDGVVFRCILEKKEK